METLEFIDYIFDRYAYLEVAPSATQEELRQVIRRRRAENHPDKLQHVSEAIQKTAARARELLDDCARVLLDDELRRLYDAKLAEYRESEPHLVSTSGTPLLDPTRFRLDLDYLLQSQVEDLAHLQAYAAQMSGHDERRLEKARNRFARDRADLDNREDLREALTRKLTYLGALEDFYWQKAGVMGGTSLNEDHGAVSPEHFVRQLEKNLVRIADQAGTAVLQRNAYASLGFTPVLLLTAEGHESGTGPQAHELTTQVVKAFQARAEDLRELVEQKSRVIDELTHVSRWAPLNTLKDTPYIDILLVRSDAEVDAAWPGSEVTQVGVYLRLERATGAGAPVLAKLSPQELASWPQELVALEPNPEIPGLLLEAAALAHRLLNPESTAT